MAPLIGYHNTSDLPIKMGQMVTIPKGTKVKSTHPHRKDYVTKRKMTIKVNHLGSGESWSIGNLYRKEGQPDDFRLTGVNDRDLHYLAECLGLPHSNKAEDDAALATLIDIAKQNLKPSNDTGTAFNAFVPVHNPCVTWAGTGGYWCDVDINDILPKAV